jgi:hypothetical protein
MDRYGEDRAMTRLTDMALAEGCLHQQRIENRSAARTARAAQQRARERQRGPVVPVIPQWAGKRQADAARAVAADLLVREKSASKVLRRWEAVPLREAPAGCVPAFMIIGARVVRLCVDGSGALRLIEGGVPGCIITVAEACARAAGR